MIPVIYNPTAGGGRARRRRKDLEKVALREKVHLDWRPTRAAGHATELAAEAADESHPLIFAFGGDGTYNEVARALLGRKTAMGVLPAGTTSVLAYEFEIPRPVGRGMLALLKGKDRKMRVGRTDQGDIFLMMLSAGPDSMVLQNLIPAFKVLGGRVGVAAQAMLELFRPGGFPRIQLHAGGENLDCGWVIVGNSRCYAGALEGTPGANPFSDDLQVVAQQKCGRRAALSFAASMARGRHVKRADVRCTIAEELRLETGTQRHLAYQVDGDVAGRLPVRVSMHPESIWVRLPQG